MENCPNCDTLKSTLKEHGIDFEERNLETKEAIIELRYCACFPQEAPVLQFGKPVMNRRLSLGRMGGYISISFTGFPER